MGELIERKKTALAQASEEFVAVQTMGGLAERWCAARTAGAPEAEALEQQAMDTLRARGWQPDYLTVRRRSDLQTVTAEDAPGTLVALGAARLGSTRLIDNLEF